jgi:hypothetical protein
VISFKTRTTRFIPALITRISGALIAHRATHFQQSAACNITFTKHYLALMHGGQIVSVTWRCSRNGCSWDIRQEMTRTCQALGALHDSAVISHLAKSQSDLHGVTGMYKQHRRKRNKQKNNRKSFAVTPWPEPAWFDSQHRQAGSFFLKHQDWPRFPGLTEPPIHYLPDDSLGVMLTAHFCLASRSVTTETTIYDEN